MKLVERTDPPRLAEDGASELGRLMRLASTRTMDAGTSERLARGLEARGAFAAAIGQSSGGARAVLGRLGSAKLAVLALVAIGGAVITWRSAASSEHSKPAAAVERPPSTAARAANDPMAQPTAPELLAIPVEALPSSAASAAPSVQRASGPARAFVRPSVGGAPPAVATSTETYPVAAAETEFALIRRAQSALASDPAGALAIVEEHARRFPTGELVQERELSAVEALARLGRKAEAKRRAHDLLERFPRTPYVARLERALGEPLSTSKPAR